MLPNAAVHHVRDRGTLLNAGVAPQTVRECLYVPTHAPDRSMIGQKWPKVDFADDVPPSAEREHLRNDEWLFHGIASSLPSCHRGPPQGLTGIKLCIALPTNGSTGSASGSLSLEDDGRVRGQQEEQMFDEGAEVEAIELARKALAILDGANVGDTIFAAHLSHALDAVIDRRQRAATLATLQGDGQATHHNGVPSDPAFPCFTTIDGRPLSVNTGSVLHVTTNEHQTVLLLVDGTEERVSEPFELVVERLGLPRSVALTASADGLIAVGAARHQLRNLLAIVSALVNQSLDTGGPTIETGREVAARIAMLTRISDLMLQPRARFNDLETLARASLAEGGTGRVRLKGPALPIGSANGAALALALHELEVHALRSGALSTRDGYIELCWEISALDKPYLWLQWAERHGPVRQVPLADGIGKRMLLQATPRRLRGEAALQELPSGLVWSLHAPVASLCA